MRPQLSVIADMGAVRAALLWRFADDLSHYCSKAGRLRAPALPADRAGSLPAEPVAPRRPALSYNTLFEVEPHPRHPCRSRGLFGWQRTISVCKTAVHNCSQVRLAALRVDVPRDSHSAERFSLRCAGGRAIFPAAADALASMRADAGVPAGSSEQDLQTAFVSGPGGAATWGAASGGSDWLETAAEAERPAAGAKHAESNAESASVYGMGRPCSADVLAVLPSALVICDCT